MKVGTDGVLVGAWAGVRPSDARILDIGTGTGLIALMMAQRVASAQVVGVDVDDVAQARANAEASPWSGRVSFVQCPVQVYAPAEPFDLIVSNPPFFVDSLTCPDAGRTAARHAVLLPYDQLCDAVVRLLAPAGRFAVILPVTEAERFLAVCRGKLCPTRRTDVRTTPRRMPKRALLEFVRADFAVDPDSACQAGLACSPASAHDRFPASAYSPLFASSPASASACSPTAAPVCSPASASACSTTCAPVCSPASVSACSPTCAPVCSPASAPACSPTAAPVCSPTSVSACSPASVSACSPTCAPATAPVSAPTASPPSGSVLPSASVARKPADRVVRSELVIGTGEHECYTPEYRALTREFYLKF